MPVLHSATFWIPGTPQGQGRPQITTRIRYWCRDAFTGEKRLESKILEHPIVRPNPKTAVEAKRVRKIARDAMARLGVSRIEGPAFLGVTAVFVAPPSWSRTKREASIWHTDKPDATNILKLVEDAGNRQQRRGEWARALEEELAGVLWDDDQQASVVCARKIYGRQEGQLVTVAELDPRSLELRPADCQGVSWPVTDQVRSVLVGGEEQMGLEATA